MAKESYVTIGSFESTSKSSTILWARKKRVCKLMDYFLNEKAEHYHKLLIDSEEIIWVIKSSELSKAVKSTVTDLIPTMEELFSARQISPAANCFMEDVTNSATKVVLNCEKVHKALMAIKNNINKEDDQDVQTQKEKKIVEKKDKKEHKAGNLNHFVLLMKNELTQVNAKLNITKNQVRKLENKQKNTFLKPIFCFYSDKYQESSIHFCKK